LCLEVRDDAPDDSVDGGAGRDAGEWDEGDTQTSVERFRACGGASRRR
jgi:hypothetical protein